MLPIQQIIIDAIQSVQWAEIEDQTMEMPRWVYDSRFDKPDSPISAVTESKARGPVLKFRFYDSFVYLNYYTGSHPTIKTQQQNVSYADPQLISKITNILENSLAANATRVVMSHGTKYSKYRSYDG